MNEGKPPGLPLCFQGLSLIDCWTMCTERLAQKFGCVCVHCIYGFIAKPVEEKGNFHLS